MSAHPSPVPPAVIVLGMHRSGTSCLAGSLQQAGLFLGAVNEAAPYNARGNRENRAIMDLHNDLLRANEGSWDRPPEKVAWSRAHKARRDALIAAYPADRTWGFKDPRTLLTLHGWLDAMPGARCIGTFRHPLAVCRSLESRNKFSREKSLGLWMAYNRRLLRHRRRLGFSLMSFDWSPGRYHRQLARLVHDLGFAEPAQGFSFFTPALRKNTAPDDEPLPAPVIELYRNLKDAAA